MLPPNLQPQQSQPRSRAYLIGWLGLVIAAGLGSRSGTDWLPTWLAENAGDALWTVAVYLSLALVRPTSRPTTLACLALAISVAVEVSQLFHPPWMDNLRHTLPGRLLLGQGWQAADLARYAAGAALAYAVDRLLYRTPRR